MHNQDSFIFLKANSVLKAFNQILVAAILLPIALFIWAYISGLSKDAPREALPWSSVNAEQVAPIPGYSGFVTRLSQSDFSDARAFSNQSGFLFDETRANQSLEFALIFVDASDEAAKDIIESAQNNLPIHTKGFAQAIIVPYLDSSALVEQDSLIKAQSAFSLFCNKTQIEKNNDRNQFCTNSPNERIARLQANYLIFSNGLGLDNHPKGATNSIVIIAANGNVGWVDADKTTSIRNLDAFLKLNKE